jgi:integrase
VSTSRRGAGEGSIYRRADGRWEGRIDLGWESGKRKRKFVYAKTRREVADKLVKVLKAHQDGLALPDERRRLAEFLEWWLTEEVETSERAESTKADYAWITRHYLIPNLGHLALAKLRPQDVQSLRNRLIRKGLSERTVQYVHSVLRLALSKAQDMEMVGRNVAALVKVKRPRTDPTKVFAFSVDEARRLLETAKGDRLEAIYSVALALGLRRGEALGLRWSDVDFETRTLRIEQQVQRVRGKGLIIKALPKTKSSRRMLRVPEFCLEALKAHRLRQGQERLSAACSRC